MTQNVLNILKKWSPDAILTKEDLPKMPVWVKLHNVPMVALSSGRLSRGSFARTLIKLDVTCGLNDRLVVAIPKIFGHLCDNFPKQSSTSKAQPKDEKQKDVQDVGLQSVKRKTSTCGNWKSQ
ncbi:phosphonates import ATP-binding protein like protein, partial [Tanacetum coccineum]